MFKKSKYDSPLGELLLVSDEDFLRGIWFVDQKYLGANYPLDEMVVEDSPSIQLAKSWLNAYFSGENPVSTDLPLCPEGTDFRQKVWRLLGQIPYGQTMTYKEIAQKIAQQEGKTTFSAQAVGGAVGHNPLSIVIPCHRVVGSNGSLIGYAGGLDRKQTLLELEKRNRQN